jgi:uncharacterized membrane protein YbhN (UPF0104 family)
VTWRAGARWALGIALVGALVLALDPAAIATLLGAANLPLVVVGVAGLTSLHLLGAVTWRTLTRRLTGLTLGWSTTVRLYYAAQAMGGFTPANIGSDAYRVIALRGTGDGTRRMALPIVVQRVTSYLAVSLIGAAALIIASRPAGFTVGVTIGALVVSVVALGVASLVTVGPGPLRPVRERLLGPGGPDGRRMATAAASGLVLGLVFHALGVGLTWLLVVAVEPAAISPAALAAVALARLSLLVPITPSGLGIQEAALAGLFIGIGLPAESALAASLLARLSMVLTAVLGAIALAAPAPATAEFEPSATHGRPRRPGPLENQP